MDLGEDKRLGDDNREESSVSSGSNASLEEFQSDYEKRATLEMKTVVTTDKFTDVYLGDTHELERSAISKGRQQKIKTACRWSMVTCLLVGAITVAVLIGVGIIEVRSQSSYVKIQPKILLLSDGVWSQNLPHLSEVPNAFKTDFKITNMKWDELLRNSESELYQTLATLTETNIKEALQELGPVTVKVVRFSSDDEILRVTGAVMWPPNIAVSTTKIKDQMTKIIRQNNGRLHNQFRVDIKSVSVAKVVKNCRALGCRNSDCEFSFEYLKFFCWCDEDTIDRVDCVLRNSSRTLDQETNDLTKESLEDSIKQSPLDNSAAEIIEISELDTDDGRDNHKVAVNPEVELEKLFSDAEGSGLVNVEEFITNANNDFDNLENELFIVDNEDPEQIMIPEDEEEMTTIATADKGGIKIEIEENICLTKIERHQLCDNIVDCMNGEDEYACEFGPCLESEFSCLSGRCIPQSWKCDGRPDCDSGEDEVACVSSCPDGQFKCGEGRCIANSLLCDGVADCGQADDEADAVCQCEAADQYQCQLGGGCVQAEQRCDGQYQCPDRSDEWNCININDNTLQIRDGSENWSTVCADQWTNDWTHNVCSSLGYTSLKSHVNVTRNSDADQHYWILNNTSKMSPELIQNFRSQSEDMECKSNSSIQLACDSHDCGLWSGDSDPWPSLALLFHVPTKLTCTATILTPSYLLTSAQCVNNLSDKKQQYVVFAGPPHSASILDMESTQILIVKDIINHPGFRKYQHMTSHDVTLVSLYEPFTFSPGLGAACLMQDPVPDQCIIVGWRSSNEKGISFSMLSLAVDSFVPTSQCNSSYGEMIQSQNDFCIKTNCQFDIGSSLLCRNGEGGWNLSGLLSKVGVCDGQRNQRPDIFTSLAEQKSWIRSEVASLQ